VTNNFTMSEVLAVMTARMIEDHKTIFVGVGLPMLSAALAQKLHAPNITIIFEGGIVAPQLKPTMLPLSTNEVRAARKSLMLPSIDEVFFYLQRGYIDYGILGAAQIDMYGNINTSVIGNYSRPAVRFPGSGGANDIASTCTRTIISTFLEKRRFVEKVDFITSPGFLAGYNSRQRSGLIFGKPYKIVTNLAIMGFEEESKKIRLEAVYDGVDIDDVLKNMSFQPIIPSRIKTVELPSREELETLRSLDPNRVLLRA
jgi:glutaconate CoA-transferase subunit B